MNYRQLQERIANHILHEKYIMQTKFGDVYTVNNDQDTLYPLICLELNNIKLNDNKTTEYSYRMFVIDRVVEDFNNESEVVTEAVYTLHHLQSYFSTFVDEIDFKFNNNLTFFNQDFRDKCAGVYCNVTFIDNTTYNWCE